MPRRDSASAQKRMLAISSWLIVLGAALLACVGGIYWYGQFEAWAAQQPRALALTQVIWPDVPPVTPLPSPSPTPTPVPGPPVRIEIPRLGIDRAVIPIGLVERSGQLEWDVESLFATSSRPDLVGQLQGTTFPGQPGNIILTGHNYNRGIYNWTGVFLWLDTLQAGDQVFLINEDDARFTYVVERVEQLPWPATSPEDRLAHSIYYAPTPDEVLTLVTCSGGTLAPFPARVYVRARRAPDQD